MAGFLLLWVLAAGGCESPEEKAHRYSVRTQIEEKEAASPAEARAHGLSSAPYLVTEVTVAAQGFERNPFRVEARQRTLAAFPCSGCHGKPLARLGAAGGDARGSARRVAHRDVGLFHATPATLTCLTCHEDGSRMQKLRLLGGSRVGFDHAYRLCAQCHSPQVKDWAGGAHGKRLGGWAPPRVVQNCTGCHNPHDPLRPVASPRWPAIVPRAVSK